MWKSKKGKEAGAIKQRCNCAKAVALAYCALILLANCGIEGRT